MAVELGLEGLIAAHERIRDHDAATPLEHSEALSSRLGFELRLKQGNLQLTGSIKVRGTSHKPVFDGRDAIYSCSVSSFHPSPLWVTTKSHRRIVAKARPT